MKKLFPTLQIQRNHVYLDNAATSLKLKSVVDAVADCDIRLPLNSHSFSYGESHQELQAKIAQTRSVIADWLNCESREISFTPSTTHSLNFLALAIEQILEKDDIIFTSKLEHSSNVYPWLTVCERRGAILEYLPLDEDFKICLEKLEKLIDGRVKIVTLNHVSNNLGVVNDIKRISSIIKKKNPDCIIIVDGCQGIVQEKINFGEWKIDAFVFSGHKVYGPTGIGVLWMSGKAEEKIPHLLWGGGKESPSYFAKKNKSEISSPLNKFEIGTLPIAQIIGLYEVFLFLKELKWDKEMRKISSLRSYALAEFEKIPNLIVYNSKLSSKSILFNFENFHSHDLAQFLSRNNIFVRAGSFCSPFLRELIGTNSALRVSLAIYNVKDDIDKLVECLKKVNLENLVF